jgi:transcriptional regulator with XRE-family HTH domain
LNINAEKIKSLRQSKGWTQQHLADACDLSLRTIQRVERHGVASKETVLSLCAVFEQTMASIIPIEEELEQVMSFSFFTQVPVFLIGGVLGAILMKLFG